MKADAVFTWDQAPLTPNMAPQLSKRPSENDWESHRTELERLYSADNKSLREVMSIMKERYGWTAA